MAKRVCYIHIGPHKTGTSSIQWFLKQNRAELLKHGYFVPESGTNHGAHHAIARKLCGQELRDHQQSAATNIARALDAASCEAVIFSSEALEGLLKHRDYAKAFFTRIRELNLEPKLVLFPRNQPQRINSNYSQVVKTFRQSEPFEVFVQGVTQGFGFRYSPLIELADAHDTELIARPFTRKTIAHGVVPEFLRALGIDSSQFRDPDVRRNEAAGPFTVSVARGVLRLIGGKQLKWLQAMRSKTRLSEYLEEEGLADAGYCGRLLRWRGKSKENCAWITMRLRSASGAGRGQRFLPPMSATSLHQTTSRYAGQTNPPSARLGPAIREMTAIVEGILLDPALAVETPWNDWQRRAGWTPERRSKGVAAEVRRT